MVNSGIDATLSSRSTQPFYCCGYNKTGNLLSECPCSMSNVSSLYEHNHYNMRNRPTYTTHSIKCGFEGVLNCSIQYNKSKNQHYFTTVQTSVPLVTQTILIRHKLHHKGLLFRDQHKQQINFKSTTTNSPGMTTTCDSLLTVRFQDQLVNSSFPAWFIFIKDKNRPNVTWGQIWQSRYRVV